MLLVSVVTLLGIKLPVPQFSHQSNSQKTDVGSIFLLGVFSGITSACCAPVLVGILTLTFLSPNFFGALLIGAMYVLGMVTPLLLISLFLDNKVPNMAVLRRPLVTFSFRKHDFLINLSNLIGGMIFFVTGFFTIILTYTGIITEKGMERFTKIIQNAAGGIDNLIGNNPILNIIFFAIVVIFIFWVVKKTKKS